MKEDNPIQIIDALKRGNKLALAKLYDLYGDIIYGLAMEIVKDENLAQEVLQDTFVKVWKRIAQYDPDKSRFFSWLYKIGRNTAIDKYRSIRKHEDFDSSIIYNGYVVEGHYHDRMDTETMLTQIDDNFEEVIRLSYINGYTQVEISKLLNLPLGTVKSRIRIGLDKLRRIYKEPTLVIIMAIFQLSINYHG